MTDSRPAYDAIRTDGVLRVERDGTDEGTNTESEVKTQTEWLSTGWNGGRRTAACAYNVSVPEGWERTDLATYVDERLERAGFDRGDSTDDEVPVLLTGVDLEDARGARRGSVTVYATAGISNPAALPMDPDTTHGPTTDDSRPGTGTVNLIVCTTRRLEPGALANLVAVAAEAKAATLLAETGFPGTTTDAIVVGHDLSGEPTEFSGSGTDVGAATRACVREAVQASLQAHYTERDEQVPDSVEKATYGVSTDIRADVFRPATVGSASGTEDRSK